MAKQNTTTVIASIAVLILAGVGAWFFFADSPAIVMQPVVLNDNPDDHAQADPKKEPKRGGRNRSEPEDVKIDDKKKDKPFDEWTDEEIKRRTGRTDLPGGVAP